MTIIVILALSLRNNPSVCPPPMSSPHPLPNALCYPGLMDVVYRVRVGPRVAPRKLASAAGWRVASQFLYALVGHLLFRVLVSPGRRPLPEPMSFPTPYPTSHNPAMAQMGRKGCNSAKTKKDLNCKLSGKPRYIIPTKKHSLMKNSLTKQYNHNHAIHCDNGFIRDSTKHSCSMHINKAY